MPAVKKKKPYKKCLYCGKIMPYLYGQSIPEYLKLRKFCDKKCKAMFYKTAKRSLCLQCGTETKNQKFCCRECYTKYIYNQKHYCYICKKPLKEPRLIRFGQKFFCSHYCFTKFVGGEERVKYCYKCKKPIYPTSGVKADYQYVEKHKDCSLYKEL